MSWLDSSLPRLNGHNTFICIFVNEKFCILVKISLKFVPTGPIDDNPALVQIMAWRRIGNKPLSEPMLTRFTDTDICGIRGRWVNINPCLNTFWPIVNWNPRDKINWNLNQNTNIFFQGNLFEYCLPWISMFVHNALLDKIWYDNIIFV